MDYKVNLNSTSTAESAIGPQSDVKSGFFTDGVSDSVVRTLVDVKEVSQKLRKDPILMDIIQKCSSVGNLNLLYLHICVSYI